MGCAASAAEVASDHIEEVGGSSSTASAPAFTDGSLEDYSLLGKLGQGIFATVHAARDLDGRYVALKVLDLREDDGQGWSPADLCDRRGAAFMQEASILEKVGGALHVVQFHGSFVEGGLGYLVMEKCEGDLLQALNRLPSLTEKTVSYMLRDVLSGLSAIHAAGVVHRDIKPDNVLCSAVDGSVRIVDFGLASVLTPDVPSLTGVFGTPPYMCPEMLRQEAYGCAADLWSFGVVLYSVLYGRFPYEPHQRTNQAMKDAIMVGDPAPAFSPPAQLAGEHRVSARARDLAAALLTRIPSSRLTARAALRQRFFQEPGSADLQPMLRSAMRAGAFCAAPRLSTATMSNVDRRLATLKVSAAWSKSSSSCATSFSIRPRKLDEDDCDDSTEATSATPTQMSMRISGSP